MTASEKIVHEGIGSDRIICPVAVIDEPMVSGELSAQDLEDIATARAKYGVPSTILCKRLRAHRRRIVATGRRLLGWDELRKRE